MPSSLDPQESKGLFALFKGESGTGKTVAALSFPCVHVSDYDHKMPAIAKKHFPGKDIHYNHYRDIFEVSDQLVAWDDYCPYETLVFDSVTSLSTMTLNSIATVKGEETIKILSKLRQTKSGSKMIELMSIDYYNGETRFIQNYWIDELKKLWAKPGNPRHVIIIAHVLVSDSAPDLKTKVVTTSRSIVTAGRKVAAYIPTQFDEMYNFTVLHPTLDSSTLRHVCCTEALGEDNAKTAYRLPNIIDFTNGSLYNEISKRVNLEEHKQVLAIEGQISNPFA